MADAPADAGAQKKGLPGSVQTMLKGMAGDMKFLGILQIILGALYSLTIIGAAIGVPYIFAGMRLKNAGEGFVAYAGSAEAGRLKSALEDQAKFFRIIKILVIVSIVLTVVGVGFAIFMSMYMASQMMQSY
jgi:hypothetical protein